MKTLTRYIVPVLLLAALSSQSWAKAVDFKAMRQEANGKIAKALGIKADEIQKVRKAGFGLEIGFLYLVAASECKVDVQVLIDLSDSGLSWPKICEKYGTTYASVVERALQLRKDFNMQFPPDTLQERIRAISMDQAHRKEGVTYDFKH